MTEKVTQAVDPTEKDDDRETTLEEAFARLDELLNRMSDKNVSLDDSFAAYEEGVRLLKYCNDHLDRVEKRVLKLNEEGALDEF